MSVRANHELCEMIPEMNGAQYLTPDQQKALAEMRAEGMSTRKIAKELGIDHSTVIRDGQKSGGADAPPVINPDARQQKALEMRAAGAKQVEIAEELGVSQSAISLMLKNADEKSDGDVPKVTGRDGKKYRASKPRPRKPKPDAGLMESVRQRMIGNLQKISDKCEQYKWNEAADLIKRAKLSLKEKQ